MSHHVSHWDTAWTSARIPLYLCPQRIRSTRPDPYINPCHGTAETFLQFLLYVLLWPIFIRKYR